MWRILIPALTVDEIANQYKYRMTQAELEALPSYKLFGYCASRFDDDQYWEEFVRRFNQCLTLSVYQAYRRFSGEVQPPLEIVSDLLQEVYLKILKDKCSALRRFRGESEIEAEVYLMHIATSTTIDRLRRQHSVKRYVRTESLDHPRPPEELWNRRDNMIGLYTDELAENDVVKVLRRAFTGKNSKRNILIFLLHYRDGFTPQEIAKIDVFDLRPSSIAHILDRMRKKIREVMFIEKS